jgi:hypothetical protein
MIVIAVIVVLLHSRGTPTVEMTMTLGAPSGMIKTGVALLGLTDLTAKFPLLVPFYMGAFHSQFVFS